MKKQTQTEANQPTSAKKKRRHLAEQEPVEMLDPVNQNLETIVNIHRQMERDINQHQRAIEKVTAFLGRPRFVYIIIILVGLWIGINLLVGDIGLHALDPAPFSWLIDTVNIGALLMTAVVLVTQNRQNRVNERRRHLDLQFDMLTDQKVTKILTMLEELRNDLPSVETIHDPEVEVMRRTADPKQVLTSLDQMLIDATEKEEIAEKEEE